MPHVNDDPDESTGLSEEECAVRSEAIAEQLARWANWSCVLGVVGLIPLIVRAVFALFEHAVNLDFPKSAARYADVLILLAILAGGAAAQLGHVAIGRENTLNRSLAVTGMILGILCLSGGLSGFVISFFLP